MALPVTVEPRTSRFIPDNRRDNSDRAKYLSKGCVGYYAPHFRVIKTLLKLQYFCLFSKTSSLQYCTIRRSFVLSTISIVVTIIAHIMREDNNITYISRVSCGVVVFRALDRSQNWKAGHTNKYQIIILKQNCCYSFALREDKNWTGRLRHHR